MVGINYELLQSLSGIVQAITPIAGLIVGFRNKC